MYVNDLIKDVNVAEDCSNLDAQPDLTFMIDGIDYVLHPKDYVLQITQDGETQCVCGIMGAELPADRKFIFILGDVFIRPYPTHFDKNNDKVRFVVNA